MLTFVKGVVTVKPKPVIIGAKYSGKHIQYFDGRTGEYWEILPPIVDTDELKVQKGLLQ